MNLTWVMPAEEEVFGISITCRIRAELCLFVRMYDKMTLNHPRRMVFLCHSSGEMGWVYGFFCLSESTQAGGRSRFFPVEGGNP
ncbi:hypothetical protein BBR47_31050 [Brevibacillus brevis NBRC 100599]|uniref:Uncharacterized protein n=1 Tax=Brevibacillus brevis (strain 47 / JCM 6285 / NBRC 100599) TaxID=358681 RepID=C0ZE73_BREBN|nr:hypothetical protein BBR47_31050 [Brevibacillus brevis NBRC 100599]